MRTGRPPKISVLGISHQAQGVHNVEFRQVTDEAYERYVKEELSSGSVDFLFEEANGLGQTTASKLSANFLKAGHYLDVEPHFRSGTRLASRLCSARLEEK